jgi:hypothetical protein
MSSSWPVVEAGELTGQLLDALFAGDVAAVRIPGLVSPDACRVVAESVASNGFDYHETLDPPLGRIGITQHEHRADKTGYFRQTELAHRTRERIFADAEDPVPQVIDALTPAWPGKVGLATEDAHGPYFAGIVRITIGGVRVHTDWTPEDSIGWHVGEITGQLIWNLYYDTTEQGGLTTVYRRRSTAESRTVRPVPGELILFNSRNPHSVSPATGNGVCISASSFVGSMPDNSLVLWS